MSVEFLTERAPGLLASLGVEDEEDLFLLLLFWSLLRLHAASFPPELAKLN